MPNRDRWLELPDEVARLMGRFLYYSAWLDDVLGEVVIHGNPYATHVAESTPDWAASGTRLAAALRRVKVEHPTMMDSLASQLEDLNGIRNQLVHGVWLWQKDRVLIMKRALGKGERTVDYGEMTYAEIEVVVREYQRLCEIADQIVRVLKETNPASAAMDAAFTCPQDAGPLKAVMRAGTLFNICTTCPWEAEARPGSLWPEADG